jgi:predicted metal-binding protein
MKVSVCTSCTEDGAFLDVVRAGLPACAVEGVDCMSGCTRAQTVAFRAAGKTAYLFGDITPADLPDLQNFARLYAATPDGTFADARVLGALRSKAIARIPG